MIAVCSHLNPEILDAPYHSCEVLFVCILNSVTLCCYYRPHTGDELTSFIEDFDYIFKRYPSDHFLLVGDMNFPGFNWKNDTIKNGTQYKDRYLLFKSFLDDYNLVQVIEEPTRVHGNTLDLICTTNPIHISASVLRPGISDHYLLDININHCLRISSKPIRSTRHYKRSNNEKFQEILHSTLLELNHFLRKLLKIQSHWFLKSLNSKRAGLVQQNCQEASHQTQENLQLIQENQKFILSK